MRALRNALIGSLFIALVADLGVLIWAVLDLSERIDAAMAAQVPIVALLVIARAARAKEGR